MGAPPPDLSINWLFSTCPACAAKLRFPAAEAGRGFGKCPVCGGRVPAAGAQPAPPAEKPTVSPALSRPRGATWLRDVATNLWTWVRDVYTFPWHNSINLRIWLLLSGGMAMVVGLAGFGNSLLHRWTYAGNAPPLGIVVYSVFVLSALFTSGFAAVYFLEIVQCTSSGSADVRWPEVGLVGRVMQTVRLIAIGACGVVPVAALAIAFRVPVPAGAIGWSVASVPLVTFFPLILLAALSNDSWSIWNGATLWSVLQRPLTLAGIWLMSATFLFGCTWLGHQILVEYRFRWIAVAGPVWAAFLIIYARMLGQLAWLTTRAESKRRRRRKRHGQRAPQSVPTPAPAAPRRVAAGVVFQCPVCREYFEISREGIGQRCTCPHCGAGSVPVPGPTLPNRQDTRTPSSTAGEGAKTTSLELSPSAPFAQQPAARLPAAAPPAGGKPQQQQRPLPAATPPAAARQVEKVYLPDSGDSVYDIQPGSSDEARAPAAPAPPPPAMESKKPQATPAPAPRSQWRDFTYPLLALFLLPLALELKRPHVPLQQRLEDTLAGQPYEVRQRLDALRNPPGRKRSDAPRTLEQRADDAVTILPGNRLDGALLPARTWIHWGFAAASVALFIALLCVVFPPSRAPLRQVVLVGLLAATFGLLFLYVVQYLADWAAPAPTLWFAQFRGSGLASVITIVLQIIGFSYRAALDPNNGLLISLIGFTVGVGLCEEFCKAVPVIQEVRHQSRMSWHGFCRWGLAAGAGFGVAEAIRYAAEHANGKEAAAAYVIRFTTCVALQAIWTAAAAVMFYRLRAYFRGPMGWRDWPIPMVGALGVPMILHGLFDTLLKKDLQAQALVVAVVSVAWLTLLIETTRWQTRSDRVDPLDTF